MRKLLLLAGMLLTAFSCAFAQPGTLPSSTKTIKEMVREAELYVNREQFKQAQNVLHQIIKKKERFPIAYRMLGLVNTKLRQHQAAIEAYEKLFELQPELSKAAYFECAESYMKQMEYEKALSFFHTYKNADNKDYKADEQTAMIAYDMYLERNINSCKYARTVDTEIYYEPAKNLGNNINTPADEYLPALTGDGKWLVFTSNLYGENILVAQQKDGNSWTKARSISKAINTPRNEAMAKITVCGRTVYFSACAWENVEGGCDVYEADFDALSEFGIVDEVKPTKGINSKKWDSQPAISCDGKTMFFASNREGGQGGTDLWMSTIGKDGIWNPPVNLGPTINTKGDEEAPYIAPDGMTLYFSSDGHPGFGDADIFRTIMEDKNKWTKPENIGLSVNSPYREAGIFISPDGKNAFFSSSRDSGIGGLDVYQVGIHRAIAPKMTNVMVDAYIYDASTKEPIEDVKVKVGKAANKHKQLFETDKDGRFFVCLPDNSSYSYILNKDGYQMFVGADFFKRKDDEPTKKIEIFMVPAVTKTKRKGPPQRRLRKNLSVYYDSGDYELSELQKEQIQRMVNQFEDKSKLTIKITGFADDVGNVEFNKALSEERAELVAKYVFSLGLSQTQIKHNGGGVIEGNIAKHQKRRVEIIVNNK